VRGSRRVGRSAAGRALEERALVSATVASVRHEDTAYDGLLMAGVPRDEARIRVRAAVDEVLDRWRLFGSVASEPFNAAWSAKRSAERSEGGR
jgi:hypothetical protein